MQSAGPSRSFFLSFDILGATLFSFFACRDFFVWSNMGNLERDTAEYSNEMIRYGTPEANAASAQEPSLRVTSREAARSRQFTVS